MTDKAFPDLFRIRQKFPRPRVDDISATAAVEMEKLLKASGIGAGKKIGITVGSRGIQNIVPMLRSAIAVARAFEAEPVLLAAMGSHGGGTEAGQMELLESFGITEQALNAPVVPCTKGREVGVTTSNLKAYMLESAFTVDALILFNRVKTHTSFKGDIESGLLKKLVVGLGGPQGAQQFHSQGRADELSAVLRDVGTVILERVPVIGGIAIIENAHEETALIKSVLRDTLLRDEAELLEYSKSLMPRLPTHQIDVLIVEEMGKNFSGTGMDTNIVGRLRIQGEPEPVDPFVRYLAVWDITEDSHGNACGIGLADFTTAKLVQKIDRKSTYLNCLTTTFPIRAKIPLYLDKEKEVLEAMFLCLQGRVAPKDVRMVVVPNTLFLTECYISESLVSELRGNPNIEFLGAAEPITFTANKEMRPRLSGAQ